MTIISTAPVVVRLEKLGRCGRCTCGHQTEHFKFNLSKCPRCKQGVHHSVLCDNDIKSISSQIYYVTPTGNHDVSIALPVEANVFFCDQGSKRPFISQSLLTQLSLNPSGTVNVKLSVFILPFSKGGEGRKVGKMEEKKKGRTEGNEEEREKGRGKGRREERREEGNEGVEGRKYLTS